MAVLLTGGVAPNIDTPPIVLTLTDLGDVGYVKINGVECSPGTYAVEVGKKIVLTVNGDYDNSSYIRVFLFGTQVVRAISAAYTYDTYLYPDTNITISVGSPVSGETTVYIAETEVA